MSAESRLPESALRQALARFPGVRLAVLFGSQARGNAGESSDVDVAVLARGEDLLSIADALAQASHREVDVVSWTIRPSPCSRT